MFELTSVFHHLSSVSPKQLCALAYLECTHLVFKWIAAYFQQENRENMGQQVMLMKYTSYNISLFLKESLNFSLSFDDTFF